MARMPYTYLAPAGCDRVKCLSVDNSADERKTDAFSSCSSWDTGDGDRLQNTLAEIWEVLLLGRMLTRTVLLI